MSRVSYAMMQRGRVGRDDGGRPQGAQRAARPARDAAPAIKPRRRSSSSRSSATRSCTTSCSASTRSRSARRRSRSRRIGPSTVRAAELDLADPSRRPRLRPAVHRRPRRRGHGRRDPRRGAPPESRSSSSSSTSARTPRSSSATATSCSPRRRRPGPAFEGAQISGGQRAAPGAIERVRIDRETLEPRFRVIGVELWSDEPGFAEATAETGHHRASAASGIVEVIAELFLAGVITPDGIVDGSLAARTPRIVSRTAGRSATSSTTAPPRAGRGSPSPRTTSGRSSSRRPRSTPASGC